MNVKQSLLGIAVLMMVMAACSAPAARPDAMMAKETPTADAMMPKETPASDMMMEKETPTADAMMAKETPAADAMMPKETPTADAMMPKATPTADAMMGQAEMSAPAWFNASLTDVNAGRSFKVADLHGKVVLVETMAVWCTTCLQQQVQIQALRGMLGQRDDVATLSLDIDPNENDAILMKHASGRGFDWMFAVAPADVAREIGKLYGDQFLNPPSAPMFIIDRQGKVHTLPFGVKSAQDLEAAIEPFLKQGT